MRRTAAVLYLVLLTSACSSEPRAPAPAGGRVAAQVASADLYAGTPQRVLVGMFADDGRLVSFGTVRFSFAYTGTGDEALGSQPGPEADAAYLPTPGTPAGDGAPKLTPPEEARGVYQATGVEFDRAGIWAVTVEADVDGLGPISADASFLVGEEPALPAPGDPALRTENLTLDSKGVPSGAVDSLAVAGGPITDPELHRWTIADAIDEGRPVLVAFATPAFCVSRFCGPIVTEVQNLYRDYRDRAAFVHVEIWRDYEDGAINEAAADWLQLPNGDLTEPWVYLIDAKGVIADRWNSLFDPEELAAELDALPPMK